MAVRAVSALRRQESGLAVLSAGGVPRGVYRVYGVCTTRDPLSQLLEISQKKAPLGAVSDTRLRRASEKGPQGPSWLTPLDESPTPNDQGIWKPSPGKEP